MTQKNTKSSFLIAAPQSNSGKTLFTLGLIRLLTKRGKKVQAFKCGPDYIDTMHHKNISGQPSYNLDFWMSSKQHIKDIYNINSTKADVSIIEGAMGLFDGAKKSAGSAAEISQILSQPVILVVDASGVAYSIAPLLYGFKNFDKKINIAGVVFNKVGSENHYLFLKEAAADIGIESLGYILRDSELTIKSRHLGLQLPDEKDFISIIDKASQNIAKHVDVDKLLAITQQPVNYVDVPSHKLIATKKKIAIAHDAAFNFTYQANLDVLQQMGDIIYFSPLKDKTLPSADLVWFPGGYPEMYAKELSQNHSMHSSIIDYCKQNKTIIAECGGMMYLGNSLELKDNSIYKMVGIFDFGTSLKAMHLHLGYREINIGDLTLKCHEFHYSDITKTSKDIEQAIVLNARKKEVKMEIFRKNNCWASYAHLYLGEYNKMEKFLKHLNF